MQKARKVKLDLRRRVYTDTPPIIFSGPKGDIKDYATFKKLIAAFTNEKQQFPFEHELVLYLLLIAAIWPGDEGRLLNAARLFSGALNHHLAPTRYRSKHAYSGKQHQRSTKTQLADLKEFNRKFFARLGGQQSLLFCPSSADFHRDLWKQIAVLTMAHDVLEYLIKTAGLSSRINSVTFAYYAIANNIFSRQGGYGVAVGEKRKRLKPGQVTTVETVRAKCKQAPETLLLSFVLTSMYGLHFFDPASPWFFPRLFNTIQHSSGAGLVKLLSAVRDQLLGAKAKQNLSIVKWSQLAVSSKVSWAVTYTLSSNELERTLAMNKEVAKRPITPEEEAAIRERHKNWWGQIPGP